MSNPQLGLVFTKTEHCIEYTPLKSFNSFVHSAADAVKTSWRTSSVVAETMKLPPNSSYGYRIMDRSWNNVTKYLSYEKTLAADNKNLSKKLDHLINSMYKAELSKPKDWSQRTNPCRVFQFALCTTTNAGTVLQIFHRSLWREQVWKVGNWHRFFSVPCFCREGTGRLRPAWNENIKNDCSQKIAVTVSLLMHPQFSSRECAVTSTKLGQEKTGTFERRIRCT